MLDLRQDSMGRVRTMLESILLVQLIFGPNFG